MSESPLYTLFSRQHTFSDAKGQIRTNSKKHSIDNVRNSNDASTNFHSKIFVRLTSQSPHTHSPQASWLILPTVDLQRLQRHPQVSLTLRMDREVDLAARKCFLLRISRFSMDDLYLSSSFCTTLTLINNCPILNCTPQLKSFLDTFIFKLQSFDLLLS